MGRDEKMERIFIVVNSYSRRVGSGFPLYFLEREREAGEKKRQKIMNL